MRTYYSLDSTGEHTNLQLYALRHARRLWEELMIDYARDRETTENLHERCVLIVATLGLSIAQLLGQNATSVGSRVQMPVQIFSDFVDVHKMCEFELQEKTHEPEA
jgi:hypothetical protein